MDPTQYILMLVCIFALKHSVLVLFRPVYGSSLRLSYFQSGLLDRERSAYLRPHKPKLKRKVARLSGLELRKQRFEVRPEGRAIL